MKLLSELNVKIFADGADKASMLELYRNPLHPYTQALLSAVPIPDPEVQKRRIILPGDVPSPLNPPPGCAFHPRCHKREDICLREEPEFQVLGGDHWLACHLR